MAISDIRSDMPVLKCILLQFAIDTQSKNSRESQNDRSNSDSDEKKFVLFLLEKESNSLQPLPQ